MITLSSLGAEVEGTSLVPLNCSLRIKSGSSAYSEKKKIRKMNDCIQLLYANYFKQLNLHGHSTYAAKIETFLLNNVVMKCRPLGTVDF